MKRLAILIVIGVVLLPSLPSGQSTAPLFYAVKGDVYSRGCTGCAEKITTAWGPYLDGKRSVNEALTQLVLAFK